MIAAVALSATASVVSGDALAEAKPPEARKASGAAPLARRDKLALRSASPNRTGVPRFSKFELALDLTATYDNPFDADDVTVEAVLTSPQGKVWRIPAFLDQPFTRRLIEGKERIEAAGDPVWRVRFAPATPGAWRYRISARDRSGSVSLPEAGFTVTASPQPGFVRRSTRNPLAFAFEGERPFFAVGENMGWGGQRGSFDFDDWLGALGQAGGNWMRIWMCSWNCALEWSADPKGDRRVGSYHGAGVYSLDNAWKLDTILDTAERNGIYVMVCFGTYGEFKEGGFFGEGQWKANPYNVENGARARSPKSSGLMSRRENCISGGCAISWRAMATARLSTRGSSGTKPKRLPRGWPRWRVT